MRAAPLRPWSRAGAWAPGGAGALRQRGAAAVAPLSTLPRFTYEVSKLYDTNYLGVPTLPLPTVQSTLERYLETVRPHAKTAGEFENSKRLAAQFAKEHAPALHAELAGKVKPGNYPYSYIEEYWDDMYLGGRFEIMVGSNPYYYFPDEKDPAKAAPTARAAALASACLRFWLKVKSGALEADMDKDKPNCMFGFGLIFGAFREPGVGRDRMVTNFERKHIVVICNHQLFRVEVIDAQGRAISAGKLKAALDDVQARALATPGDAAADVGVLTAQERDYWARARAELLKGPALNAKTLGVVDDCLFAICLDQVDLRSAREAAEQFLFGGFLSRGGPGTNRWFDKHNIIVTKDGSMGFTFDHTFGDGLTWNRMLGECFAELEGKPSGFSKLPAPRDFDAKVDALRWDLPEPVRKIMPQARENARKLAADVDTHVLDFSDFGRDRMKEMKCSPDALVQMAFQVAYWRLHGEAPGTYESCAMKNFFHGRTETIRSCTNESTAMVQAFLNNAPEEDKRAALHKACAVHVEVAKGAKIAASNKWQGVDRHLYAMKCLATKKGIVDSIPFFKDPLYVKSSTWVLSTSNVTAPFIKLFGFGAVTGHGYGLGYMTMQNNIPVAITSYRSSGKTNSNKMGDAIAQALRDFNKLF